MESRIRDGWKIFLRGVLKRSTLRLPWGDDTPEGPARCFGNAQGAQGQQQFALATAVCLPVDLDWERCPEPSEPTSAPETREDYFGRRGISDGEVQSLARLLLPCYYSAEAFANAVEQIREIVRFVERAHKVVAGLKLRDNYGNFHESHNEAVKVLDLLLLMRRFDRTWAVEEIRDELKKQLPGTIFPRAESRLQLDQLIDCARNIGIWLAERGAYSCRCRAMPELAQELRVAYEELDRRLGFLDLDDE